MDRGVLPVKVEPGPVVGEQAGGEAPVAGGLGVAARLGRVPVPGEPPGAGCVQPGHLARRGAPQLQQQQVGEHLVVAEPGPLGVQRHHERTGLFQVLQDPLPSVVAGQQVSQVPVDPLQDAGAQQQPPDLLGLPVKNLGQQVFRHRPFGAGELRGEPGRVRMPGQRQRRQPQPGRPALGPPMQRRQRRGGKLHPGGRQQLPGIFQGELQVIGADLGLLALQPQPVQTKTHVVPGRQHEPQLRRGAHHQQLELPRRLQVEFVHVIDHQPQPVIQRCQVRQQPLHQRPRV